MSQDQNSTGATTVLGHASAATPSKPPMAGADSFLSSLAELEGRIGTLKSLHEQASARDLELSERQRLVAEREEEIAARERTLGSAMAGFEKTRAEFDERARALAARDGELSAREAAFAGREESLAAREAAVQTDLQNADRARAEIDEIASQVAQRESALAEENASMMRREDNIEMKIEGAERLREQIMSRASEIASREAKVVRETAELNTKAAQFERQVANRHAEIERAEADLAERERDLSTRAVKTEAELTRIAREQEEIDSSRAEIAAAREELVAMRDATERARAEIERRDKDIADRAFALSEQRTALESERAESEQRIRDEQDALHQRENQAKEHEIDLAALRDELERERAGVTEQARTLAAQLKAQDDNETAAIWNNRVETMQIELGQSNADRASLQTEVAQLRENIETITRELIEANQNRGVPETEVEARERKIADLAGALEESRAIAGTLQERIDSLETTIREAEEARTREIEGRDDQIRAHTERLAAHSRQLDEAIQRAERADAEKSGMVSRGEVERLERELAAARDLLDQAEATAMSRVPVEEVVRRDQTIKNLENAVRVAEESAVKLSLQEIESKEAVIADLRERLEEAAKESSGTDSTIAREFTRVSEEAEALRARLQDAERAMAEASQADNGEEQQSLIAELRARAEKAEQTAEALAAQSSDTNEAEELRAQLEEARAEIETLRTTADQAPSLDDTGPGGPTPAELLRRDRLRRYKSLLQTQARKIVSAQTALQRRHADCEMVLTNRSRLAELAQQLARAEKRMSAGKARTGAAAAILYMSATIGILAGLSWEVSKRIWPGTYIARCVIEADAGRRTPNPEDLKQWQSDHKDLLSDPRLIEMAAERMQRRGLSPVADPAGLASRLKDDLYVQSSRPGSMTIELRGEGAERTALFLDTLATSFKTFADQARDERANDIGVTIAQAAAAGTEPLMDKRLERAGGVFGGAVLAAGLAGLVIWSRLVRAKRKFDHAAAVESALEEVDWTALESSIRKHSGKDGAKAETA